MLVVKRVWRPESREVKVKRQSPGRGCYTSSSPTQKPTHIFSINIVVSEIHDPDARVPTIAHLSQPLLLIRLKKESGGRYSIFQGSSLFLTCLLVVLAGKPRAGQLQVRRRLPSTSTRLKVLKRQCHVPRIQLAVHFHLGNAADICACFSF